MYYMLYSTYYILYSTYSNSILYLNCIKYYLTYLISEVGGKAQAAPTGKSCFVFVFALRACERASVRACVRAKLCEEVKVEVFRVYRLPPRRANCRW